MRRPSTWSRSTRRRKTSSNSSNRWCSIIAWARARALSRAALVRAMRAPQLTSYQRRRLLQRSPNEHSNGSHALAKADQTKAEERHRPRRRDLSRAAPRHHRAGAGARREAAGGRDRRALRRKPHHRAACAGPACRRRPGGAAPQSRRRRRDAELGRGARHLRRAAWARALVVSRLAGQLTPEQVNRLNAHVDEEERARGNNEPLSIRLADRVPYPAGGDDRQPGADALCQRDASRCGLDPRALQPAAFVRMRGQRAPRHHRGASQGRCGARHRADARASRSRGGPRADRAAADQGPRSEGYSRPLCRGRHWPSARRAERRRR